MGVSKPMTLMRLFHPCTLCVIPVMDGMLVASLAASFETNTVFSIVKKLIADISLPSTEARVSRNNSTALKAPVKTT